MLYTCPCINYFLCKLGIRVWKNFSFMLVILQKFIDCNLLVMVVLSFVLKGTFQKTTKTEAFILEPQIKAGFCSL
jgi:hypothetical protein